MKRIFIALLLLVPFLVQSQNYTNICSQGPAFYKKLNTNQLKAFKYTSYVLPGGGDTIFYTFPTLRDTGATCLDTTKGSILGRKIYRQGATKMFFFFNRNNDTIYVNAKAQLNDTWRFVKLTLGTWLEAKVVAIAPDSVMGVLDDVMRIELQARRNDGTPIASPWNGKFIKLSKNYGLSRIFDFNNVPFDTTNYTLVGKLKPAIGVQDFGWREVYNYNIGDAMHFSGYTNDASGTNSTWKEIQTVFAKTSYGANNDSVVYKIDRCRSTVTNPGGNHVYFNDTLTIKYKFNVLNNDSTILRMPDQFVRRNVYASQFDRYMKAFNNRQTKKITEDKYRFLNNCFTIPTGSVILYRNYSEGLGQTEYYRDDQTTQDFSRLVYFKKGSETWGNPVGTVCSPLLDIDEMSVPAALQARIVPNPVNDRARLKLENFRSGDSFTLTVFNLVGKELMQVNVVSADTPLNFNNLPAGLYLYTLKGQKTSLTGKFITE